MSKLSKEDRQEYAHKAIEQAEQQLSKGQEDTPTPKEESPDDDDFASLKEQSINLKNKMDVARSQWP